MKQILQDEKIAKFQEKVMKWWAKNKRHLPWRESPTPYNVMVSEVMLQQTQVNRVVSKYEEFLEEFPDFEALANANQKHLLKVWSGLGYNRRALWLKDAALSVVSLGEFPRNASELRKLKGIGPYTSKSILIFAFNEDIAAVDTNIRRVLISTGFAREDMSLQELQGIADRILLKGRSSDWHNALMDYGAMELTASSTGIAPLTTQTCFEGSTRQLRGALVRILAHSERLSFSQMMQHPDLEECDREVLEDVLESLVQEEILERAAQNVYKIAE